MENLKTSDSFDELKNTVELSIGGSSRDVNKQATQMDPLSERVKDLEEHVVKLSLKNEMSQAGHAAVSKVNHTLLSSKPRNRTAVEQVMDGLSILKQYTFAKLQCVLMLLALAFAVVYGVFCFQRAYFSVNDTYKPFKIDGIENNNAIENYDADGRYRYEYPLNYFQFFIFPTYTADFDCGSYLSESSCLRAFLLDQFRSSFSLSCIQSGDEDVSSFSVDLNVNFTRIDGYSVIVRLEVDTDIYWERNGKNYCVIQLNMDELDRNIGDVLDLGPWVRFWVSRQELLDSEINESDQSVKWILVDYHMSGVSRLYGYYMEESKYDGYSNVTADFFLEGEFEDDDDSYIFISVYPPSSVMNFVSYATYSYQDALASLGGYFSLSLTVFVIFSSQITKCANRGGLFHVNQGILPYFSMSHRNAEEIAVLRSITLAGFGVSEKDYFSVVNSKVTLEDL